MSQYYHRELVYLTEYQPPGLAAQLFQNGTASTTGHRGNPAAAGRRVVRPAPEVKEACVAAFQQDFVVADAGSDVIEGEDSCQNTTPLILTQKNRKVRCSKTLAVRAF